MEPPYQDMPEFFKENKITVIGSLPCYTKQNVEEQRGIGSFEDSIAALKKLNNAGYGKILELNLVHNPLGTYLPGFQKQLEEDYKKHLKKEYGIVFNNLFTLTNMPLGRFETMLKLNNAYSEYMQLLVNNYNSENLKSVMCKTQISVDWQGKLYNCDFNQPANLPIKDEKGQILTTKNLAEIQNRKNKIMTAAHCYGCMAGAGSSCEGVLN
jgi:radical SAM/Cys-rich protein